MSGGEDVSEQSADMPDRLDASARAALDAIQSRLDETWDVEAGLREVLLDSRYERSVGDQATGLDVETGLTEVLGRDSEVSPKPKAVDKINAATVTVSVEVTFSTASTIDRLKAVASDLEDALNDLRRADEDGSGRFVLDLSPVADVVNKMGALAERIEARTVSRDDALAVVRIATEAFTGLYQRLLKVDSKWLLPDSWPKPGRIKNLAKAASKLELPIALLFDPSDETAGVML